MAEGLCEAVVRCWPGLLLSDGTAGLTSGFQFLFTWDSTEGMTCPHDMTADFPQSRRSKREQGRKPQGPHAISSEVTHCHFHSIPLALQVRTSQRPMPNGRSIWKHNHQEGRITGAILTAILEAGYYVLLLWLRLHSLPPQLLGLTF